MSAISDSPDNVLPADVVPLGQSAPGAVAVTAARRPTSIRFQLDDGRIIGMAKPQVSLTEPLAKILEGKTFLSPVVYETERVRVKALLYVTDIDGNPEPRIFDSIMRQALEQKLGDDCLEAVLEQYVQNFPASNAKLLDAVKK
jgi:hypothetical protein